MDLIQDHPTVREVHIHIQLDQLLHLVIILDHHLAHHLGLEVLHIVGDLEPLDHQEHRDPLQKGDNKKGSFKLPFFIIIKD